MAQNLMSNGGHFYGHSVPSFDIAKEVMKRLRFDNETQAEVTELVLYHDSKIEPTPRVVKRWLNKIGQKRLSQLLNVQEADIQAHSEGTQEERLRKNKELRDILAAVVAENECFSLKDLAVNGNDIIALGYPQGKIVGDILKKLLSAVIDGDIPNEKEALIAKAKEELP